jgi:hypothetical protein
MDGPLARGGVLAKLAELHLAILVRCTDPGV